MKYKQFDGVGAQSRYYGIVRIIEQMVYFARSIWLEYANPRNTLDKSNLTQFGRTMDQQGIDMIAVYLS